MNHFVVSKTAAGMFRILFGLALLIELVGPLPGAFAAGGENVLLTEDCIKCHWLQVQRLAESGGAHAEEVGCQSCHESHRPKVNDNVPPCSKCHEREPHFNLENCRDCHNPHAPLELSLQGQLKEVCISCHAIQGQELSMNPNMHAEMACNGCHEEKHGFIPECSQCHIPHFFGQTFEKCNQCHPAHKPAKAYLIPDANPQICKDCHGNVYMRWATTSSRHHELNCTICHNDHGALPKCNDCHRPAHDRKTLERFRSCLGCHLDPHDLPVKN